MSAGTRSRWRRLARVGVALALIGVVVWLVVGSVRLRMELGRAADALDRDDPAEAGRILDHYLDARPESAEAHFLAAQAARRCDNLAVALDHLKSAERLGWSPGEVELERALVAAQAGRVAEHEPLFLRALAENHTQTPHILAVLVPAYVAQFRIVEAGELSARWVAVRPDSPRAWAYRADILERLRKRQEAIAALRRLIELEPNDPAARVNLGRLLLEIRESTDEAAAHLESALSDDPDNPAALLYLAACREAQGRPAEAVALLDRLLGSHPKDAKALLRRGRLELNRGRPADALPYLRRSADADPSDPEAWYSLVLCLRQVGTPAEVTEAEDRRKRAEADLKRVGELGRAISTTPYDPDLRREMGELFLRNGREADGLRWLDSALAVQPDHAPTHRVLADHYEKAGKTDLAARHREFAPKKQP